MAEFEVRTSWLSKIEEQERELVFDSFDNSDAFEIGLLIIELAGNKYKQAVAVSIEIDNDIVFSHMMRGTYLENKVWIKRKTNVSKITKTSSLYSCVEIEHNGVKSKWLGRKDSFAVCGGCWPVKTRKEQTYAYISVSGLEHYLDHQIIVDAVSFFLDRKTETISI